VTQVSITPIPTDQSPFPLPSGVHVPTFFTIQPGGAQVIPPRAYVIYPNFTNDPPGSRINFWNYDPTEKGWYIYGQGTVSSNGKQVIPDPGVVLYEFSGLMDSTSEPHPADKYPKPGNDPGWLCRWFGICLGGPNGPGQPIVSGPTADPVDPGTGLFVYGQTDLFLRRDSSICDIPLGRGFVPVPGNKPDPAGWRARPLRPDFNRYGLG